jgi:hypothetical protein
VVEKYGSSTDALLWHWLKYGKVLGYPPVAPTTTAKVPETPHFDPNAGNTTSDSDDDDDDEHENNSTSATPSNSPSSTPANGTVTMTSGTISYGTSGYSGRINGKDVEYDPNSGELNLSSGAVVNLPVTVQDDSGTNIATIDSLAKVSHTFENIGYTATISYGNTTITKTEYQVAGGPADRYSCGGEDFDNYDEWTYPGYIRLYDGNAAAVTHELYIDKSNGATQTTHP